MITRKADAEVATSLLLAERGHHPSEEEDIWEEQSCGREASSIRLQPASE